MIPYGKHHIDDADIKAVVDVLQNQFLTQGQMGPKFEQALCDYLDVSHCVAVNSGTSALHIACLAAGVQSGDIVWTSPNSFAASANCARYCGADIDFVDIDPDTRNLCIQALGHKLEQAEKAGTLPKVVVVVHFSGLSCDMQQIRALTQKHGILVIEDVAHALGGEYNQQKIGSCQFSDMSILSFHPVKAITTGEGGAVTTNDSELAKRLNLFAKHGITRHDLLEPEAHQDEGWYYEQQHLGYNYRLSDLHAVLGLTQLKKLDDFIAQRQLQAERYSQLLEGLPVKRPMMPTDSKSAWHIYVIELENHCRKTVFNQLVEKGVGVNVHYIPIHTHPYYQSLGFKWGDFPQAENYYKMALTLPLFPSLSENEQAFVVRCLKEVLV